MPKITNPNFLAARSSSNSNFIDDDFALFDDVKDFPLYDYPERLETAAIVLCLQGKWQLDIDLKKQQLSSGSLMLIMPEQIFQSVEVSSDFSGIIILMSKRFIDNIFPKLKGLLPFFFYLKEQPCISIDEEDQKCIMDYYTFLLRRAMQSDNHCRKEIVHGLVLALFYDVYNIYKKQMPQVVVHESRKEELFEQFFHLLNSTFRKERNVIYYADKLFLTPKYLSRVVKEVSGKTAGDWIDEFVILEAKSLLKSTGKSIQEIAEELHFANQSFFGKYFKHHTELSPKEYRRSDGCVE
ncbi:AraC family transcriptional regulator [Bacteroides ihuae]|uniref:AraC family transcriptional regulator n=1 Tax=Bacteroides ihuae TaxID=1852362 RepID=UPI0008D9D3F6|nr:helix-turn-helix domain-containing protein [Bacteroides ihuae]